MAHDYYTIDGFNISRALVDFNGDIERVADYAEMHGDKENFLNSYRAKVKHWMRVNRKTMNWMASKIGMSEGSTKNLLYNNINITAEKLRALQKAMDEADATTDFITVKRIILDLDIVKEKPDFAAWCLAAGISFTFGTNEGMQEQETASLAEWTTHILMREAASALRSFIEQKNDDFSLLTKNAPAVFLGEVSLTYPLVKKDIVLDETTLCSSQIYLPVVSEECQSQYISLAASLKNQSIEEWVITTLNKEAKTQGLANLADFISSTLD